MLRAGRAYWALGIVHTFGRSNGIASRLCLPLKLCSPKIVILINNWVRGAQFAHFWDLKLILGVVQGVFIIEFNLKLFLVLRRLYLLDWCAGDGVLISIGCFDPDWLNSLVCGVLCLRSIRGEVRGGLGLHELAAWWTSRPWFRRRCCHLRWLGCLQRYMFFWASDREVWLAFLSAEGHDISDFGLVVCFHIFILVKLREVLNQVCHMVLLTLGGLWSLFGHTIYASVDNVLRRLWLSPLVALRTLLESTSELLWDLVEKSFIINIIIESNRWWVVGVHVGSRLLVL